MEPETRNLSPTRHTHRYNARIVHPVSLDDLAGELASIEPSAAERLLPKAAHLFIRVEQLDAHTALLLKQELLALDGDALISPAVYLGERDASTDALIYASRDRVRRLLHRLAVIPLAPLQTLAAELDALLNTTESAGRSTLKVTNHHFVWGARTYIMGIINVTPDSFSADGLVQPGSDATAAALAQAQRFAEQGVDILDVGGESTRPGAQAVTIDEELSRVVPVIRELSQLGLPISVDTYHAEVAEQALDAGAQIVNDIWGLRTPSGAWNGSLAALVRERGVPIVLMHNRRAQAMLGALGGHYPSVTYHNLIGEIIGDLRESVDYAEEQGISRDRIILDPGLGFGKTPDQNLILVRRLSDFRSLGLPLLVGASRKSFIGLSLNLPAHERDEGTAAVTALAIQAGADIVRVHNVLMNVRAARIADAIVRNNNL